jgi:uncharacterized membrane protein (UPF0127 family)
MESAVCSAGGLIGAGRALSPPEAGGQQKVEMAPGSPQSFAMKLRGWGICLGAAMLLLVGCRKPIETATDPSAARIEGPTNAQQRLPTLKLWLGREELTAEVAATSLQIQTGMMFRTNIAETDGMLFILPYTQQAAFWMKNCLVELSVAYIGQDGAIREIHDLHPGNTNPVFSASADIQFALEVNQGWFSRHQVATGMVVRTERGSLVETFFRRR